jgi:hypothetical protein
MPLSKYFSGSGEKVMASMKEQYGEKKGKQVFYATANKKKKSYTGPTQKAEEREMKRMKPPSNMLGVRG